jgi:predicted amidohydrolase
MNNLRIAAVQFDIVWENRSANFFRLDELLQDLTNLDVIVLPEMFTTGFSMRPEVIAEAHHDEMETLQWMRFHASRLGALLMGTVSVADGGAYKNRMYVVFPDGRYEFYDKANLFKMGEENNHYSKGNNRLIFEWRGWRIAPLICYDLRFPEWARNGITDQQANYDLLIYSANWPEVRRHPWRTLLQARAIENQAYVVGVNRVGDDDQRIYHSGDSLIIDPRGQVMQDGAGGQESILIETLDYSALQDFRAKFPVLG